MISARIDRVLGLLNQVKKYSDIVTFNSFGDQAMVEMKSNAKDILDEAKDEIDQVKSEVDNW